MKELQEEGRAKRVEIAFFVHDVALYSSAFFPFFLHGERIVK